MNFVIGGVGLARYLDPRRDAEKYAPLPSLGWSAPTAAATWYGSRRTDCISGPRRRPGQVGGRRIELGEVDSALVHLPGVSGGAAAVRRTASGTAAGRYIASADPNFDLAAARAELSQSLPAALVPPRLVLVDELPIRTSGKGGPRRAALPPGASAEDEAPTWAARWAGWPGCGATLGAVVDGPGPISSPWAVARCQPPNW